MYYHLYSNFKLALPSIDLNSNLEAPKISKLYLTFASTLGSKVNLPSNNLASTLTNGLNPNACLVVNLSFSSIF